MRTPEDELQILRVSLARIAQGCDSIVAHEIPGADGRLELGFPELARLARERPRGWNRLALFILDYCQAMEAEAERMQSCLHAQESVPGLYQEIARLNVEIRELLANIREYQDLRST
jgi:hypothetical protein